MMIGDRVALRDGQRAAGALGQLTAYGDKLKGVVTPAIAEAKAAGRWRDAVVRAEDQAISVTVDGTTVRTFQAAGAWGGYVGLEGRKGTIEFRLQF